MSENPKHDITLNLPPVERTENPEYKMNTCSFLNIFAGITAFLMFLGAFSVGLVIADLWDGLWEYLVEIKKQWEGGGCFC